MKSPRTTPKSGALPAGTAGLGAVTAGGTAQMAARRQFFSSMRHMPLAERFALCSMPEPNSGCWLWLGTFSPQGYGMIQVPRGPQAIASHISLLLVGRPVPKGLCALHKCDNPACVNPDHLWIGTYQDNARDMHAKGRSGRPMARGEKNRSAKITASNVQSIRAEAASGVGMVVLAHRFSLTRAHVRDIVNGKYWTHITEPLDA